MQSVLGLCLGKGMRQTMLRWHYRSRHDSLIALSNRRFYGGDLVVFPSPRRQLDGEGLVYSHLPDTAYERGTTRTNPLEAEAVVAAVAEHLRTRPGLSLGVVAFSVAQRSAIEDRLEALRRQDPALEALWKECRPDEPCFIKNLENVQGDERDVILISVGYGKDGEGRLTMNFGPLGHAGGERRLNVLVTRARVCCRVFTNLRAEDLDLRRANGEGIKVFREFLELAAGAAAPPAEPQPAGDEPPLAAAVAAELRQRGFAVGTGIGSGGYRVDLAVLDSEARGTWLLGIECDGANYQDARWARDRDRLRAAVLAGLGWRLHRVWSVDWYTRREEAIARLLAAISAARAAAKAAATRPAKPAPVVLAEAVPRDAKQAARGPAGGIAPYRVARLAADLGDRHLADLDAEHLGRAFAQVVAVESPLHVEDLRRRVLDAIEGRAGTRRLAAIDNGIAAAVTAGLIRQDEDHLWDPAADGAVTPRDRSALPESARGPLLVHPAEYAAAARVVVAEAHGCADGEEVVAQVILALGVKRNDDALIRADDALRACLADGTLVKRTDGAVAVG